MNTQETCNRSRFQSLVQSFGLIGVLMCATYIDAAHAYKPYEDCRDRTVTWAGGSTSMSVSEVGFDSVSKQDLAEETILQWSKDYISATDFDISVGYNSLSTSGWNDDVNMVAFARLEEDVACNFMDTYARTYPRFDENCSHIGLDFPPTYLVEADVYLDTCYQWTTSSYYYDMLDYYGDYDALEMIQNVLTHEMGHVVGFDEFTGHDGDTDNFWAGTMNPYKGGGSIIGEDSYINDRSLYVAENARVGVRDIYPSTTNDGVIDVAAQSYVAVHKGESSDYCLYKTVRPSPYVDLDLLAQELGLEMGDCPPSTERQAALRPPTTPHPIWQTANMDLTFTLHNLGDVDLEDVTARILLSTDEALSSPYVINTFTIDLSPDVPAEVRKTVTIPSTVLAGTYYAVMQLDYDNALSEADEVNNQAFWNQQVEVYEYPPPGCGCITSPDSGVGALGITILPLLILVRRRREDAQESTG